MKQIKPSRPIELRLVLEVEPYHWSDRQTPSVGPSREHREEWQAYFRECMSDAGIAGIEPIQPGSCFVDAFTVVENELMLRMIREVFEGSGLPGFPNRDGREEISDTDPLCRLAGSFAMLGGGKVLLEPECCCDCSDLDNWKQALLEQPPNGTVWIGHPEAEISFAGDLVTIREGWEGGKRLPPPDWLVEFSISLDELREAVDRAEDARKQFAERLLPRVGELVVERALASRVTSWLMGED